MLGPAKLWKRVTSFIIDFIIIDFVLFFPFKNIMQELTPTIDITSFSSALKAVQPTPLLIAASLSMAGITILYFSIMEYKLQQTIGKMLFNIAVVHTMPNTPLKFWQTLVRCLFVIPIFPFMLLWFFDPVYIFFNSGRQRLLETISKTQTIERYVMNHGI